MPDWYRLLPALVALMTVAPAAGRAQTNDFFVLIEGTKQGVFANESGRQTHMPRVVGFNFDYLVSIPRDPATGISRGRRVHGPVVLTKEWGAASPQLFQAMVSNEVLRSVLFEFYQTNSNGEEELATTVKLTNATVTEIHQYSPSTSNASGGKHTAAAGARRQLEDISFTFGSIEIQHVPGKTMAADQMGLQR